LLYSSIQTKQNGQHGAVRWVTPSGWTLGVRGGALL